MNRILKNGEGAIDDLVRPFHRPVNETASQTQRGDEQSQSKVGQESSSSEKSPDMGVSQSAFADVAGQNEKLLLALEEAKKEIEKTKEAAFAAGKKEGLAEAVGDDEKKIALISKASDVAIEKFTDKMSSLEGLAILLAQTAVSKILGPDQHMADLVTQSIKHHIGALKDVGAITLSVSPEDFPSEQDIDFLKDHIGHPSLDLITDGKLSSGDCLLRMKLGTVDIGVPGQLQKLNNMLQEMIDGGAS